MEYLQIYERALGQLINRDKKLFCLASKCPSCSGNEHWQSNWIQKELLTFDILGSPTSIRELVSTSPLSSFLLAVGWVVTVPLIRHILVLGLLLDASLFFLSHALSASRPLLYFLCSIRKEIGPVSASGSDYLLSSSQRWVKSKKDDSVHLRWVRLGYDSQRGRKSIRHFKLVTRNPSLLISSWPNVSILSLTRWLFLCTFLKGTNDLFLYFIEWEALIFYYLIVNERRKLLSTRKQ